MYTLIYSKNREGCNPSAFNLHYFREDYWLLIAADAWFETTGKAANGGPQRGRMLSEECVPTPGLKETREVDLKVETRPCLRRILGGRIEAIRA
jgi:hypothetical protein